MTVEKLEPSVAIINNKKIEIHAFEFSLVQEMPKSYVKNDEEKGIDKVEVEENMTRREFKKVEAPAVREEELIELSKEFNLEKTVESPSK